jgi:glycosyltransferase involved in cell wall biosynthesis
MNIAVVFTKDITEGGAFQYAISVSLLLKKNQSGRHNFVFFTTLRKNIGVLKKYNLSPVYLPWSNLDRVAALLAGSQLAGNIFTKARVKRESKLDKIFKKNDIDLVYFLAPSDLALALSRFNYIFTVWDLCFLNAPEFPEVYSNREFERREKLYRLAIPKAVAVITDSEATKQDIIKKYGAAEERVVFLPFLPLNAESIFKGEHKQERVDINKKYNIAGKYIFYPAQFWPHKNHIYILEGLKLLKEKYKTEIHALFTGSDKGNLHFVLNKAKELGISNLIHYIGFVDQAELAYLYTQALALVMPTYFGPTNIPPLEAFSAGCPVLYSDLPGMREQVEGSVILLKLDNPDSFCQGLLEVIKAGPQIHAMVDNGKKKIESLIKEDRWNKLKEIFDDYAVKLKASR